MINFIHGLSVIIGLFLAAIVLYSPVIIIGYLANIAGDLHYFTGCTLAILITIRIIYCVGRWSIKNGKRT